MLGEDARNEASPPVASFPSTLTWVRGCDFTISVINSFERVFNLMASLQNLIISHILVYLQDYFLTELKKIQKFYILCEEIILKWTVHSARHAGLLFRETCSHHSESKKWIEEWIGVFTRERGGRDLKGEAFWKRRILREVLKLTGSNHRNIFTYTKHVAWQAIKTKMDKTTKAPTMAGKCLTSEHVIRLSTKQK